jgi:hypothetical protein
MSKLDNSHPLYLKGMSPPRENAGLQGLQTKNYSFSNFVRLYSAFLISESQ